VCTHLVAHLALEAAAERNRAKPQKQLSHARDHREASCARGRRVGM
jgi:hypothetical protein